MIGRRQFVAGSALLPAMFDASITMAKPGLSPLQLAADEAHWQSIANQYDRPQDVIQLENGNWGVMASPVRDAYFRHLNLINREGSVFTRQKFGSVWANVQQKVAQTLGAQPHEIALTRNATEALQILISGYNRLKPHDAVLYADHDYPAMQSAMDFLRHRRGAEVIRIALPHPASWQGLIDAYAAALDAHPQIKLILLTHVGHRSGLILPVREISDMAAARGVDVIVDAAHSLGQVDCKLPDLGANFIGFNLHKWFGVPLGVGGLYIRQNHIPAIDGHMMDLDQAGDRIHSRARIGTTNFAAVMAIPEALNFQATIGSAAKEARLRHLRSLWTETLRPLPNVEICTPADPRLSCGIAAFRLNGRTSMADNEALARRLLDQFGIFTVARDGLASGACIRITPALFNSADDMKRLVAAVSQLAAEA